MASQARKKLEQNAQKFLIERGIPDKDESVLVLADYAALQIEECAKIADAQAKQAEHDTDPWMGSISLHKGEVGRCKSIATAIRALAEEK